MSSMSAGGGKALQSTVPELLALDPPLLELLELELSPLLLLPEPPLPLPLLAVELELLLDPALPLLELELPGLFELELPVVVELPFELPPLGEVCGLFAPLTPLWLLRGLAGGSPAHPNSRLLAIDHENKTLRFIGSPRCAAAVRVGRASPVNPVGFGLATLWRCARAIGSTQSEVGAGDFSLTRKALAQATKPVT